MKLTTTIRIFVLALLVSLAPIQVFAQNAAPITFAESSVGKYWWNGGNETIIESKIPDASKFRVRAPRQDGESGGGGAFSFDVTNVPGGPSGGVEAVLLTGGLNRDGGGESGFFILKKGTWGNISDAAQIRIWEATSEALEFKVPISAPNLVAGGGGLPADYIASGAFRLYQQADGNLVQYELVSGILCARWSIWTGPIAKHTAIAPCNQ